MNTLDDTLLQKISSFPQGPGVYLMKGDKERIIYVGKAKNLRARVRQYFGEHDTRAQVVFLMRKVEAIDYLETTTEKEALLLENSLIKKHKPRYNINLKDDKTYLSLRLSVKEEFPDLKITRKIKKDGALYFGPFISADSCRQTVDFIYRHFLLRTCSNHELKNRSRPCLEYQIGRCSAPCVGYVSQSDYKTQVEQVKLFLEGRDTELVSDLKSQMKSAAADEKFEKAKQLRDLIDAISTTLEKQKVVRHQGLHQDLLALYREGDQSIVALLSVREGALVDSRYYPIERGLASPPPTGQAGLEPPPQRLLSQAVAINSDLMGEFIERFYLGDVFIPDEILISDLPDDVSALLQILAERKGKKVIIRKPQKGENHHLMEMALQNAKSHFARLIQKKVDIAAVLQKIQKLCHLPTLPKVMECYDISNTSGVLATGSRVMFVDGVPHKAGYRHYKIERDDGPDDYAMLYEMLSRRLSKSTEEESFPDLLVIDGGKGHLQVALKVLAEKNLSHLSVISIAKGSGDGARAKGSWEGKKEEEIYLPQRKNPVKFKKGSAELLLLQHLRDESHRFAIEYHRLLRDEKRLV